MPSPRSNQQCCGDSDFANNNNKLRIATGWMDGGASLDSLAHWSTAAIVVAPINYRVAVEFCNIHSIDRV